MADIKRWTILSILEPKFIEKIKSAIVFGSSGSEAILQTKEDELFAIGANYSSCLGTNNSKPTLEPTRIDMLTKKSVISFAFGVGPHVLALTSTGEVYSWGNNGYGQLGTGSSVVGPKPNLVGGSLTGERVIQVACGNHHSVVIAANGSIFTWGRNNTGQLGISNNTNQDTPCRVSGEMLNRFVRSVACGHNNTLALCDEGVVYAWGFNGNGQLGVGNLMNQNNSALVIGLHNVIISQIASGFAHSLALSDEGKLFAWGSNSCGQLCAKLPRTHQSTAVPVASEIGRIVEIASIYQCNITVVVNQSGKAYMWGLIRNQTVLAPIRTNFSSVDDVFACFANPPITCKPLKFSNEYRSSILDAIRMAFDDPTTSDIQISVDGQFIHAHKAFLRMRCDYFRSRLQEHWKDDVQCTVIEMPHYSYRVYHSFIRWLYTDELQMDFDFVNLAGLLDLANCYCEDELKTCCSEMIKKGINIDNAMNFYESAVRLGIDDLREFCFSFCLKHLTAVAQTEAFLNMDDRTSKHFVVQAAKKGAFKT